MQVATFFLASGVDDSNYGFQNDFGFAIVSVDDLDLGEKSKKCPFGRGAFYTECGH